MKKTLINKYILFVLGLAIMGCSDSFLEKKPQGVLGADVLANQNGAELALIGAYSMLDGFNDGNNVWPAAPQNWLLGSVPTDDAYKGTEANDMPEGTLLELYQWSSTNILFNQKYVALYEGVARANATINLINAAEDIADADRNRLLGEATFLRGYYHFELWKVWGNVVYMYEDDADFSKPNNASTDAGAAEVIANVIADFESAAGLLPATQGDIGRATSTAARAMAGKAHMHAGNPSAAEPHLSAANAAGTLSPCLRDVFHTSTENAGDYIFSVQASINDGGNSRNGNWLNQLAYPSGPVFGCCGFHQPSQNLVNAYKVDGAGLPLLDGSFDDTELDPGTDTVDPRLDLTVGRDDVPFWDWDVHAPDWIRDRAYAGPFSPKKVIHYAADPVGSGGWNNNAYNAINFPIIRLADVKLLLAEAIVASDPDGAQALVNEVRARAAACSQGPLGASGSAVVLPGMAAQAWATYDVQQYPAGYFAADAARAVDAIRMERRLELALEGHRMFDLQRWGIAADVLNAYTASEVSRRAYYSDARPFEDRHRWYPLPASQVELSRVDGTPTLTQNTGW